MYYNVIIKARYHNETLPMPCTVYRGKTELGFQSLAYLREGESSKCVERELEELQHIARESGGEAASSWSLASRAALRPMAVVVFLFSAQSFCGANMVNYYMVTILQVTRQHQ